MPHLPSQQNKEVQKTTLYSIVFDSAYIRVFVFILFIFFLVNPVVPALASEYNEVPVEPATDIVLNAGSIIEALSVEVPETIPEENEIDVILTTANEEVVTTNENEAPLTSEEVPVTNESEAVAPHETLTSEQNEVLNIENTSESEADINDNNEQTNNLAEPLNEVEDTTFYNQITELLMEETLVATTSSSSGTTTIIDSKMVSEEYISDIGAGPEEFIVESMLSTSSNPVSSEDRVTIDTLESDTQESTTTNNADDVSVEESLYGDAIEDGLSQQGETSFTTENEVASSTVDAIHTTETEVMGTTTDVILSSNTEEATTTNASVTAIGNETASTTTDGIPENENQIATTTQDVMPPTQAVTVLLNANNAYQFGTDECRAMGDGTFYCAKVSQTTALEEDAVYAEADEDGDLEIFVRLSGVVTQITHNLVDDSAPYYDALSNTIIWHSLLNDRYQIVSYNLDTGETTVLTNTTYNNMQPMSHGDVSFWQAWIGGNWEIVRYEDGEMTQITNNNVHDIAPYALEDLVMWQTQNGDQWDITLYDEENSTTQVISSDTAGYTKNPRLVLMYESFDANGDMQMLGYDLRSKEYIPLSSTPTSLPQQLPEPDPVGEKKALINAKPSLREDFDVEDLSPTDGTDTPTSTDTNLLQDSSTIVIPANAVVSATSSEISTASITASIDVGTSTPTSVAHIQDVVIPPTASTTPVDQVDAVVIPSFSGTSTIEVR